jgi:hypothetical protein
MGCGVFFPEQRRAGADGLLVFVGRTRDEAGDETAEVCGKENAAQDHEDGRDPSIAIVFFMDLSKVKTDLGEKEDHGHDDGNDKAEKGVVVPGRHHFSERPVVVQFHLNHSLFISP